MMKTIWQLLTLGVIIATVARAEISFLDKQIPSFNYDGTKVTQVFSDIERISKEQDPMGRGIRFVPGTNQQCEGTVNCHMTNVALREIVTFISEVVGYQSIIGEEYVYLYGFPISSPPVYHRAGIVGQITDVDTGKPITNAVFHTVSTKSNAVLITTNGHFVAAVDYLALRPFCDSMIIYRKDDDHFEIKVSAPGYVSQTINVRGGDNEAEDIKIEMKRCQPSGGAYVLPEAVKTPAHP